MAGPQSDAICSIFSAVLLVITGFVQLLGSPFSFCCNESLFTQSFISSPSLPVALRDGVSDRRYSLVVSLRVKRKRKRE
jgi:hypothetical protein